MVEVKDLMQPLVVSVPIGTSISDVAALMNDRKFGCVFVEDKGSIVGIVTETDIVRKVVGLFRHPSITEVEMVMSNPVIGIKQHSPITEAADLMDYHHTRHLAVMNDCSIVGVLSVRDLLHPVSIDEF